MLRNKALDGIYLRTALHLFSAAEMLLAQYEADVRTQANPVGAVDMCAGMQPKLENPVI